ncbi:hypothetical protein ACWXVO_02895 [Mycoplasma sp. 1890]
MKKDNKDLEFDWVDSIDKDVSFEDQLKHKKVAQRLTKAKKIRKILFWSLSGGLLSSVIIATVSIQLTKPKKALIYWFNSVKKYSFNLNNKKNKDVNIKINNDIKIDGTPESVMAKIINNSDSDNISLLFKKNVQKEISEYAIFENKNSNVKWKIEFENFVIDTLSKNTLFVDLVFKHQEGTNTEFVIRNFPIYTTLKTKQFNEETIKKKQDQFDSKFIESIRNKVAYKLLLPIDVKDKFSNEKINRYKAEFRKFIQDFNDKFSSIKNDSSKLIDYSWAFGEPHKINNGIEQMTVVSNFVTETNNFYSPILFTSPIKIEGFDNEDWKTSTRIKFKGRIITLSTNKEKLGRYHSQYGIYIEPNYGNNQKEIEFDVPLFFEKG